MKFRDGRKECALGFSNAEEDADGSWTCQISAVDENGNPYSTSTTVDVSVICKFVNTFIILYLLLMIFFPFLKNFIVLIYNFIRSV